MAGFSLPDFPRVDGDVLREISRRHGLDVEAASPLPEVGVFNRIYPLGDDLVLRVPRDHPAFVAAARKESVAVPAARGAGVRTPRMVSFDDALDLLPVPYSVYERVHGEPLGLLDLDPAEAPRGLELEPMPDLRPWPDEIAAEGYLTSTEARWFSSWLERLAPAALAPVGRCFLHGDSQATNVMVEAGTLEYTAVLDWGGSGWGDPAWDYAGVPLRVVPPMLEGYREAAPPEGDETVEARILWRHLQLGLYLLRRDPQPGRSWAERPLGMLVDITRFFLDEPGKEWRRWTP